MPIYEYRCSDCGFQNEYLQKVSERPMRVCPSCGKAAFAKLLSAAGFQLKGSGWYATDFKHSGAKPAKAGATKGDAKSEVKADAAKGEAKAEAKADAAKSEAKTEAKAEAKADAKSKTAPACSTN
jgi:putative FmdB family regulatory protein